MEGKSNCCHAACFASLELHHPGEANDALSPKRSKRSWGPHCALGSSAQHTLPKAQKLHSLHSYPCALLMACGHLFSYTEQLSLQLCLKDTQKSPQKFWDKASYLIHKLVCSNNQTCPKAVVRTVCWKNIVLLVVSYRYAKQSWS